MDPLDFLIVADKLKCSSDEAERRTAVSRSYYSVFNYLKACLEKHGIRISPSASGHEQLIQYLRNSGIAEAKVSGQIVRDLRSERNKADYRMELKSFSAGTCSLLYDKARRAIDKFNSCISKGSVFIDGINDYKKLRDG
jgi:uncharacterized protein (UPF0332 family)